MCGINGFTWKDWSLLERMNAETAHRGPDGSGTFFDEDVSLGHNRLAIIDPSDAGAQPMKSADGTLTIVFNGELYNFEALRRELSGGWEFKTRTDTEVILAAYRAWGTACVSRFNGMFAFAIWDASERQLFLARDHIGIKPLYYFYDGARFIFSSEIKAIFVHDIIPRTLNREAFGIYLRTLYTPSPHTMFQYVHKLPPAHRAILKGPALHVEPYWKIEDAAPQIPKTREERAGTLQKLIEEATARQLVSDRPLGMYLSGGLDSSIVLASAARVHGTMDTFSVGFTLQSGEEEEKFNADSILAERTAEYFSARHHSVKIAPEEVISLFEKAVYHLDEPISNPTVVAQMKLAEFTRQSVVVALSGDGGDELFGGYERYQLSRLASLYQKFTPSQLRALGTQLESKFLGSDRLQKLATPPGVERFGLFMFQKEPEIRAVVSEAYRQDTATPFFDKNFFSAANGEFEKIFMNTDRQSWLVDECLTRGDKMTMASGLEMRVPLLDLAVAEYAYHLPLEEKFNQRQNKILLREAFRERLPAYLFEEPKRGWFSPASKWLRRPEIMAFAREVLSPSYNEATRALFDWKGVEQMLDDHIERRHYNLTMLWALLTFQLWAKKYNIHL